ncbi:MAG: spondin domain-containing protein [Planctomycetota bacterium]
MNTPIALISAAAIAALAPLASAQSVSVTIENLQADGGFAFTPFWIAAHNGGFDSYDGGATLDAFPGTEELAELGQTGPISDAFANSAAGLAGGVDATVTAPSTSPPVFVPGDAQTFALNVGDASVNRYFSYASMLISSNDIFVANGNPLAIELFDAAGNFNGPVTITLFGSDLNDGGTEANVALEGAAFLAGVDATAGTVTNDPVRNLFTPGNEDADAAYLDSFLGLSNPIYTFSESIRAETPLARITIVPAPSAAGLLAIAGLVGTRRRRA